MCSYIFQYIFHALLTIAFLSAGVSGKEGAIHLASKAMMKKNTNKSVSFEENTIIEPISETEDSLQMVMR